jgi:monoamine oxidase
VPLQHEPNGSYQSPHIAVIGAGFAGLRCADILLQHGFKVTIIEGRDRVGGRVHQSQLKNGRLVDLGPNWIHGTAENPMMDLAKQTDTPVGNPDIASYLIDEFGNRLQQDIGEKYADMMWDIVQDAFKHSNQNNADIGVGESLHDFFRLKVEEKIPESEPDYKENRKLVMQLSEQWGAFVGSPIERQSLKFFWLEECIEGGTFIAAPPMPLELLMDVRECLLRGNLQEDIEQGRTACYSWSRYHLQHQSQQDLVPDHCQ